MKLRPIGVVRSPRTEAGDQRWGRVTAEIHLKPGFARGLRGLRQFSHALIVFWMHQASFQPNRDLVRRPRGRRDLPLTGIFAQRARHRPNPIGITAVRIVEVTRRIVKVRGLDAIDGTPVLDVKPYVPAFDCRPDARVPGWMDALTRGYF